MFQVINFAIHDSIPEYIRPSGKAAPGCDDLSFPGLPPPGEQTPQRSTAEWAAAARRDDPDAAIRVERPDPSPGIHIKKKTPPGWRGFPVI